MLQAVKTKHIVDILDPDVKDSDIERKRMEYLDIDYRVIRLPAKIDDMILQSDITKEDLRGMIRQARKV